MGFLCGFAGALFGAVIGVSAAYFAVAAAENGDEFAITFTAVVWGPLGLVLGMILGSVAALRLLRFVRRNKELSRPKCSSVLVISGSVAAAAVLVPLLLGGAQRYIDTPPDRQLLDSFKTHRLALNQLAQMKLADKNLMSVSDDRTQPSDPQTVNVPHERIARYRRLLNKAGIRGGLEANGLGGVDFACWAQGSATSSDEFKGYAYLATPPKHVLLSLDNYQPDGENTAEVYRHIEGGWYLYYEYIPG